MKKKLKFILLPLLISTSFALINRENNIEVAKASEEVEFTIDNKIGKETEGALENLYDNNSDTYCWLDKSIGGANGTLEYNFSSPLHLRSITFDSGFIRDGSLADYANGTISYKDENDVYHNLFNVYAENNVVNYQLDTINVSAKSIKLTLSGQEQWVCIKEFNFNTFDKYFYTEGLDSSNGEIPSNNKNYHLAVDDDLDTYTWLNPSNNEGNPALILDLVKPTRFNYISLTMDGRLEYNNDYIRSCGLMYSNNPDFSDATSVNFTLTRDGFTGRSYAYLKEPVEATYVKAYALESYTGWVIVNDFSVGYTIELSSGLDIYTGKRSDVPYSFIENATDLNNSTYFDISCDAASSAKDCYFTYDFGSVVKIDSLLIGHGASYGDNFTSAPIVSYSLNGSDYNVLNTKFDSSLILFTNTTDIEMRYIKVQFTSRQWVTLTQFSFNNLYNFKEYLSHLTCDNLKSNGVEITTTNDYLYSKLTTEEINELTSEELHKYNYYRNYVNHVASTSNLIHIDIFNSSFSLFSILAVISLIILSFFTIVKFKRGKI